MFFNILFYSFEYLLSMGFIPGSKGEGASCGLWNN